MSLLVSYSSRSLLTRRLTTILTASGMALVVFVFAAMVMLAEGLEKTLVDTGSPDNVVVIRRSAKSEVESGIERIQASLVETLPQIALDSAGRTLSAKELVVLITLPKKGAGSKANVVIRGVEEASYALRSQVDLAVGRWPRPGSLEIAVGGSVVRNSRGVRLGASIPFANRSWEVVGVFNAAGTGFSSEIWGDADQLMQAFRRPVYSSVIFRLRDPADFDDVKALIDGDPRLTLEAKRETDYYREQSEMMAKFLRVLGTSLTLVFSIGAVVGAMITMYASVANRVAEIGTLRALGFQRRSILLAFLLESMILGFAGGCGGLLAASALQLITVSTTNFQTFSEIAFNFSLSLKITGQALGFSVLMGLAGGLLPAIRAARLNIVEALRES